MDTINTTTDTHAVTKFVEPEEMPHEEATFTPISIDSSDHSSIADFLARPVLQYNSFWSTTDLASTDLVPLGVGLPSDGILKTNPMYVDKLKGYNLVRATINYRIQINSNPFQQGRLLAHFLPFALEMNDGYKKMHNFDLTTKTQQPSVEVDCRGAGAILSIPFLAPTTHYELHTGHCPVFERGRLHLSVLSPLKTSGTGTQDVEVAIWVYFTDVELRAPIIPQAGKAGKRSSRSRMYARAITAEESSSVEATGSVSRGLMMASSIASAISSIPMMSAIAAPASWALAATSGVASAFGYSKPDVDAPPMPMSNQYDKYMATSDGVSPAVPLAATSTNSLSMENYSYGDVDEMSTAFLYGVSAFVDTFEFGTADVHDSVLYSKVISPTHLTVETAYTTGADTQTVTTAPPMGYLTSKFKYWRGTIKLRLSMVRTEMQSGRLQITFTPLSAASPILPSVVTGSYAIRQIVDITTDEDVEIIIPYMLPVPYLVLGQGSGVLEVRVVNQLRSPETAAQSIDILVFASGGADFELAVPCNRTGYNIQPVVPQSGVNETLEMPGPIVPQSGGDETMETSVLPELEFASSCVGERIFSVRQMIRFSCLPRSGALPTDITWWPWAFAPYAMSGVQSYPFHYASMTGDTYNYVAGMYALYRGGMDVMLEDASNSISRAFLDFADEPGQYIAATVSADIEGTATSGISTGATKFAGTGINVRVSESGLAVAAVPYYNRFPVSLNNPMVADGGTDYVPTDGSQPLTKIGLFVGSSGSPTYIARRIREDFQWSLFVGCPPYVVQATIP